MVEAIAVAVAVAFCALAWRAPPTQAPLVATGPTPSPHDLLIGIAAAAVVG